MKSKISLFILATTVLLAACGSQTPDSAKLSAEGAAQPASQASPAPADHSGHEPMQQSAAHAAHSLDVYKSETCGCCGEWIDYMETRDFAVAVHHPVDLAAKKQELGVDARYQSCHTAVSEEGYVFEGHIPAGLIARFLAEKPAGAVGLAVPGMPLGSPGMEVGDRFTPYEVLLLKEDGTSEVYASIASPADQ